MVCCCPLSRCPVAVTPDWRNSLLLLLLLLLLLIGTVSAYRLGRGWLAR
jgi:hypothetical protein